MRRYLLALLLALFTIPQPGLALQEGRDFMELPFAPPVETGDKIEVREFFWYGCPHCFTLEPAINAWLKKMPANAQFVRTPAVSRNWLVHAQAYYAFEALGAVDKLHGPLFHAIDEARRAANNPRLNPFADEASLADFVVRHGVDREKFREAFGSFAVRMKVERAKKAGDDFLISSVPAIVVDGRYVTNPIIAGGEEAVMRVVNELIARAARERGKAKR